MDKAKQLKLIQQLADIFQELDWLVAIPMDTKECQGLIVGEKQFVEAVAKKYYGEQAEIISPNTDEKLTLEVSEDIEDANDDDDSDDEGKTIH